uniref:Uncharacterized protein n=1 Tax=Chromera velia CCMP2878 TaxID=1169474 RepID=A0A0G4F6Y2_9ALVE|eukprot:Cvel_15512.t2-p1 / transcript=Cvel_15512.t2 / gene=Cvel_15512 / organism=Chromera_velia_CCMP2878 / gene_product=hypothetical protein / transcript_product=hypothetical protein / location=Cvel_scaffold1152:7656-21616(-) / protein_length=1166 / sequence_SO=supercontig / SO=protein_coding / is_pseudo=false
MKGHKNWVLSMGLSLVLWGHAVVISDAHNQRTATKFPLHQGAVFMAIVAVGSPFQMRFPAFVFSTVNLLASHAVGKYLFISQWGAPEDHMETAVMMFLGGFVMFLVRGVGDSAFLTAVEFAGIKERRYRVPSKNIPSSPLVQSARGSQSPECCVSVDVRTERGLEGTPAIGRDAQPECPYDKSPALLSGGPRENCAVTDRTDLEALGDEGGEREVECEAEKAMEFCETEGSFEDGLQADVTQSGKVSLFLHGGSPLIPSSGTQTERTPQAAPPSASQPLSNGTVPLPPLLQAVRRISTLPPASLDGPKQGAVPTSVSFSQKAQKSEVSGWNETERGTASGAEGESTSLLGGTVALLQRFMGSLRTGTVTVTPSTPRGGNGTAGDLMTLNESALGASSGLSLANVTTDLSLKNAGTFRLEAPRTLLDCPRVPQSNVVQGALRQAWQAKTDRATAIRLSHGVLPDRQESTRALREASEMAAEYYSVKLLRESTQGDLQEGDLEMQTVGKFLADWSANDECGSFDYKEGEGPKICDVGGSRFKTDFDDNRFECKLNREECQEDSCSAEIEQCQNECISESDLPEDTCRELDIDRLTVTTDLPSEDEEVYTCDLESCKPDCADKIKECIKECKELGKVPEEKCDEIDENIDSVATPEHEDNPEPQPEKFECTEGMEAPKCVEDCKGLGTIPPKKCDNLRNCETNKKCVVVNRPQKKRVVDDSQDSDSRRSPHSRDPTKRGRYQSNTEPESGGKKCDEEEERQKPPDLRKSCGQYQSSPKPYKCNLEACESEETDCEKVMEDCKKECAETLPKPDCDAITKENPEVNPSFLQFPVETQVEQGKLKILRSWLSSTGEDPQSSFLQLQDQERLAESLSLSLASETDDTIRSPVTAVAPNLPSKDTAMEEDFQPTLATARHLYEKSTAQEQAAARLADKENVLRLKSLLLKIYFPLPVEDSRHIRECLVDAVFLQITNIRGVVKAVEKAEIKVDGEVITMALSQKVLDTLPGAEEMSKERSKLQSPLNVLASDSMKGIVDKTLGPLSPSDPGPGKKSDDDGRDGGDSSDDEVDESDAADLKDKILKALREGNLPEDGLYECTCAPDCGKIKLFLCAKKCEKERGVPMEECMLPIAGDMMLKCVKTGKTPDECKDHFEEKLALLQMRQTLLQSVT